MKEEQKQVSVVVRPVAQVAVGHPADEKEQTPKANTPSLLRRAWNYTKDHPSILLKILLFIIGALAACLYVKPAAQCVDSKTCGMWLVRALEHISSPDTAHSAAYWIYLLSGGIGYAGSNGYFSARVISDLPLYLASFKSTRTATIVGILLVLFALSQTAQILVTLLSASLNSGGTAYDVFSDPYTWIAVGGGIPGYLFGAMALFMGLPQIAKAISWKFKEYIWYPCSVPSPADRADREKMSYYAGIQPPFLQRIDAKYERLVAESKGDSHPMVSGQELLWQRREAQPRQKTIPGQVVSWLLWGIGAYLASSFLLPVLMGSWHALDHLLPEQSGLVYFLTGFINSTIMPNAYTLIVCPMETFYQLVANLCGCQPINSLAFQLFPYLMGVNLGFTVLITIFSYSLVNLMFDGSYPASWSGQDVQRQAANVGVDVFHLVATFLLGRELLRQAIGFFYPDSKGNQYFIAEEMHGVYHRQSRDEFAEAVEGMTPDTRQLLGIEMPVASLSPAREASASQIEPSLSQPLLMGQQSPAPEPSAWCCLFNKKKQKSQPGMEMPERLAFTPV